MKLSSAFISADSTSSCSNSVSRKSAKRALTEPIDKTTSLQYLNEHKVSNTMLVQYAKLMDNEGYLYLFVNVKKDYDERIEFLNEMLAVEMGKTA